MACLLAFCESSIGKKVVEELGKLIQHRLMSAWRKRVHPLFKETGVIRETLEIMDETVPIARNLGLEAKKDVIVGLIMEHETELKTEELQEILNEEYQET